MTTRPRRRRSTDRDRRPGPLPRPAGRRVDQAAVAALDPLDAAAGLPVRRRVQRQRQPRRPPELADTYPRGRRRCSACTGRSATRSPRPATCCSFSSSATIGALTIVGEQASGLIRATFAAVRARGAMVAAKAAVTGRGDARLRRGSPRRRRSGSPGPDPRRPGRRWSSADRVLRAVVASAVLVPVCALVGMGLRRARPSTPPGGRCRTAVSSSCR